MTIDPLKVPCPFCGRLPEEADYDDWISCPDCCPRIEPGSWIEGGINTLAGKLMKENIFVELHPFSTKKKWTWSIVGLDRYEYTHQVFDTFEEAVLDAWEYLERKKHDHRPDDNTLSVL